MLVGVNACTVAKQWVFFYLKLKYENLKGYQLETQAASNSQTSGENNIGKGSRTSFNKYIYCSLS